MCKFCDELASWKECHDNPEYKKNKYIYCARYFCKMDGF